MVCPYCHSKTQVTNSRRQKRLNAVWRRRQCVACGAVFSTEEQMSFDTVWLVDNGNQTVPFHRETLYFSIANSIPTDTNHLIHASELTDTVIKSLQKRQTAVLSLSDIISDVESVLSKYNALAALKYASEHGRITSKRDLRRKLDNLPFN